MTSLSRQALQAIAHPCAQAQETIHSRFAWPGVNGSLRLTFNIGEE